MAERQNRADYRLALEGRSLGPGGEAPLPEFARALMERFGRRLVSLTLTEKRDGEADRLDIVLDDSDGRLEIPQPGQVLSLKLGWAAGADVAVGLVDKGRFKVDEAEWSGPPDQITIRARSANFAASFDRRRERAQVGRTLGAIVAEIAKLQGLVARVDPELASILVPVLDQDEVSDAGLLLQLGRRYDAAASVKNGTLLFLPIGKGRSATGLVLPSATITRSSGDGFAYKRAERGQYGGVEARWHDRQGGQRATVTVGDGGEPTVATSR